MISIRARTVVVSVSLVIATLLCAARTLVAQTASNPDQEPTSKLSVNQARLAERYDQLELLAGRLAELSRATQPRRARLLRELVAKSRESDIAGRFDSIVAALDAERLSSASNVQGELQVDLQKMLDLLLQEDRDKQIESERKRIRKYLAEVKKLIQRQRGVKARTDGGDEPKSLQDDQGKLSEATGKLGQEMEASEGLKADSSEQKTSSDKPRDSQQDSSDKQQPDDKPSDGDNSSDSKPDGKPTESNADDAAPANDASPSDQSQQGEQSPSGKPSDTQSSPGQPSSSPDNNESREESQSPAQRAQQRLQKAQQRMQQAMEKLEEAKQDEAVDRQEQALRELEQAKAELERILRQLREEEMERMLVMLEARFRKMLDAQVTVYELTKKLDSSQPSVPQHEIEIASSRLSRQEREIVREADRALVLLREDGTTVAFPEAIQQARDDMQSVEERLSEVKIGVITQGLEEDIIAALEETIAALQQALKEARAQQGKPQQGSGEPGEQSLVDQLAELRMIRALQDRINRRTQRYGDIIGDQPTADPDLREALDELSIRQERVFQATRDLDSGRNQ